MGIKEFVLAQINTHEAWCILFPNWKQGKNVECPVANEAHEQGTDSNPSFSLSEDGKGFCHACGYRVSSPIGVLADIEGLEFKEACKEAYTRFVRELVPEEYVKACHESLMENEYMQAVLEERRGILAPTIKRFELGWDEKKKRLVIPVRNEMGWCLNTRLHDTLGRSEVKIVSYAKGYGDARLWPQWRLSKPGPVFIFEGEMDALLADAHGIPSMSVTGGAATWKEEWSRLLKGHRVYVVPDMDKAGLKGAAVKMASLSKRCEVSLVELPNLAGTKQEKDFTDWVMHKGGSGKLLIELSESAKVKAPTKEEVQNDADEGLDIFTESSPTEKINLGRGSAAWEWLKSKGAFFKDQNHELFYAREGGTTYRVSEKSDGFISMLGSSISWLINPATSSGKFILRHILSNGTAAAKSSIAGAFSLYTDGEIYLHCENDVLVRASEGQLTIVKNALNERGVLLECPSQVKGLKPMLDADPGEAARLAWKTCFEQMPISQTNKYLVFCWWAGLFLKEYIRPKPLLRFMAKTAFGKSTATKMLSILTYGDEVLQNSATTPAALYAIAKQFPLIFMDNIETRNMTPAFEDFMLTTATGGGKSKRQIHTDSGVIWENTNCLVCTNGIEPVTKREIVSRTAEINLDLARYGGKDFNETKIFDAIKQARPTIIFGLLKLLTEKVVPRVKNREVERIARELGSHAKNRFDEYIGIQALVLDAVWPYIGDKAIEGGAKAVVAAWIRSQTVSADEQDEGTNEVLYYLSELAERGKSIADIRIRPETLPDGTIRIEGTTREVFTDFRVLARALNGKCPWSNERQLGTRISDAYTVLKKAGWDHKHKIISGRRINEFKKGNGQTNGNHKVRNMDKGAVPGQGMRKLDFPPVQGKARNGSLRGLLKKDTDKGLAADWKRVAAKGRK